MLHPNPQFVLPHHLLCGSHPGVLAGSCTPPARSRLPDWQGFLPPDCLDLDPQLPLEAGAGFAVFTVDNQDIFYTTSVERSSLHFVTGVYFLSKFRAGGRKFRKPLRRKLEEARVLL